MTDANLRDAEREYRASGSGSARGRLVAELRRAGRCVVDLARCECAACRAKSEGRARAEARRLLLRPDASLLATLRERGVTEVDMCDPLERARLKPMSVSAREIDHVPLVERWCFQVVGREFECLRCQRRALVACLWGETEKAPALCRACDPVLRLVDLLMGSAEGSMAAVVGRSLTQVEAMMRAVYRIAPPEQETKSGRLGPLVFEGYRQVFGVVAAPDRFRGRRIVAAWVEAGCPDEVVHDLVPALAPVLLGFPVGGARFMERIIRWEAPATEAARLGRGPGTGLSGMARLLDR